ncbi:unnamed protein product [Effrenium voratum]|nr:unnamed protein product [Effrenium voratum]
MRPWRWPTSRSGTSGWSSRCGPRCRALSATCGWPTPWASRRCAGPSRRRFVGARLFWASGFGVPAWRAKGGVWIPRCHQE